MDWGGATAIVLAGVFTLACAGGDGPGSGLTGSVPWDIPPEPDRPSVAEREPPPPQPSVDMVIHGTKLVSQTDDAVVVLTLVELVNRGTTPTPLPLTEVRADVVGAGSQRAECEPTEVNIEGGATLLPGERRLVWARTRCPIQGEAPQVVRSFVWLPQLDTEAREAGQAIVSPPGEIGEEGRVAASGE